MDIAPEVGKIGKMNLCPKIQTNKLLEKVN